MKEKETARKEYKQAIEKGHGAYLMDQDAPVRADLRLHERPVQQFYNQLPQ